MNVRAFAAVISAAIILAGVVAWSLDRRPPFEVLSVSPASARPGNPVMLTATVRRDINRHCGVTFARYLYLPNGFRVDLEGDQTASAEQLADMETRAPGKLSVAVAVPQWSPPGKALLVTHLQYTCNPLHKLWPIPVLTSLPFEVLPP